MPAEELSGTAKELSESAKELFGKQLPAKQVFTKQMLTDIVQWDIHTWSKGIIYWDSIIDRLCDGPGTKKVLDLGVRDGGTSLYFALKGLSCVSTDLNGASEKARKLHEQYGVSKLIRYENVDCTCMDFADNSFDIVSFKSIMGAVGANNNFENINKAFAEIHRVLKPGGILLFCENIEGSALHMFLRKRFVKWSAYWNYLTLDTINQVLGDFREHNLHTHGFFSCMVRDNIVVKWIDDRVCKRIKPDNQYMCYGYAQK